jgi:transposase
MGRMRPQGSAAELERRRRRALALLEQGESPTVIARLRGLVRPSLYSWRPLAQQRPAGLAARRQPGPARRLREAQGQELERVLQQGAPAPGGETELWSGPRVAEVIRRAVGSV